MGPGKKEQGEDYDLELLYELQILDRFRTGASLNDDEIFEVDMFEKRRDGHSLTETELEELEVLRTERESILQEAKEIEVQARG